MRNIFTEDIPYKDMTNEERAEFDAFVKKHDFDRISKEEIITFGGIVFGIFVLIALNCLLGQHNIKENKYNKKYFRRMLVGKKKMNDKLFAHNNDKVKGVNYE